MILFNFIGLSGKKRRRTVEIEIPETISNPEGLGKKLGEIHLIEEVGYNLFQFPEKGAIDAIEILDEWDIELDGEIPSIIDDYLEGKDRMSNIDDNSFVPKTDPFPHQWDAIEYAKTHDKFLLGDEQGLGKTKQAIDIAVMRKSGFKHCLIVACVAGLKWSWAEEVLIHSNEKAHILGSRINKKGNLTIDAVSKRAEDLAANHDEFFLITNIETLRDKAFQAAVEELTRSGEIGMVVLDEVHKCKSSTSQQGKAIHKLQSHFRMALSGTPLLNTPIDLFNILKWLGLERVPLYVFKERYCNLDTMGNVQGYRNLPELQEKISSIMLRRLKEDVLDLPPKIRAREYVELGTKQQKLYNDVINKIRENIDKVRLSDNPLAEIIRLRQATGNPGILTTDAIPSAKFDRAIDLAKEELSNGRSVIIFSILSEVITPLHDRMRREFPAYLVTGDVKDKMAQINKFMDGDRPAVILGTTGALGTGFTLTKASTVIFIDSPWTRGEKDQAEDRAHRIGAKDTVRILTLVAKGTIDEQIEEIVQKKGELADFIVDVGEVSTMSSLLDIIERK